MPALLLGVVVLILLLWALHAFSRSDPKQVAKVVRLIGGGGLLVVAGILVMRGQIGLAIPIGALGLGLLGWISLWPASFGARTQRSPGQVSRVRSAFLEMELDHDTGTMHGRILAGPYQDVQLDALDVAMLLKVMGEIDDESRALLAAYLDRRDPGWRANAQGDAAAGQRGPARSGKMTEEEAYQILGVQPGSSAQEIGRAHRALMKKLHPDQGGSTYLAARVNQAKDVLLRRHR
jgi:hypothetical protein